MQDSVKTEELLQHTREEAAEILRVHPRTVDRMRRDGRLRASKGPGRNGRVTISEGSIREYLRSSQDTPEIESVAR